MPDIKSGRLTSYMFGIEHLFAIRKDSLRFYKKLHSINPDAVRIQLGPYRCWFLFHPQLIEQALCKNPDKLIRFEKIMDTLRQWNGQSLLISEGSSWRERRRKVLPAFTQQRIHEYSNTVARRGQALRNKWSKEITQKGQYTNDIDAEMAAHTLDIATLTLFGQVLDSDADKIGRAVHALSEIAFHESTSPIVLPDYLPFPSKRKKSETVRLMRDSVHRISTARLSGSLDDKGDLLSMLIAHHGQDQQAIDDDSMSLLIAGHETSGATLTWLFILLAQHRDVLASVQLELDKISGGAEITFSMLPQLSQLYAAVQEAIRLYPAAYALFCRRALGAVDLGGDVSIRRGDLVQVMPYITHRDARWFEEPSLFRPERFLAEPKWPRYAYLPFGAGPRICIGQSFGLMEVMLTAAALLQKLEPQFPQDKKPLPSPRFSLRPKAGFELTWKLRNKS